MNTATNLERKSSAVRIDVLERGRMGVGVLLRHGITQSDEASLALRVVGHALLAVPVARYIVSCLSSHSHSVRSHSHSCGVTSMGPMA